MSTSAEINETATVSCSFSIDYFDKSCVVSVNCRHKVWCKFMNSDFLNAKNTKSFESRRRISEIDCTIGVS